MKRTISLLLILSFCFLSFTACSNGKKQNYDENCKLTNKYSDKVTQAVYEYILDIKGKGIISGQQSSNKKNSNFEADYINEIAGKYPAIKGLDFISHEYDEDADKTRFDDYQKVVDQATEWWQRGGLVTICWHWGTPPDGYGYESSKGEIDLTEALTDGTELNKAMIERMDEVAQYLVKLRDAGVPVLWRPFHEFDGGWFWWGKGTGEQFIQLWKLMYERYTEHWELNNLIWVLGHATNVREDWYPGDEYVDVTGFDTYSPNLPKLRYQAIYKIVEDRKPICFHECGTIPDPTALQENNMDFVWFMTWYDYLIDTSKNSTEKIKSVFTDDYVITLDELPDFKTQVK